MLANGVHFDVLGICSGLVCVGFSLYPVYCSQFVVCNPTAREFQQISSSELSYVKDGNLVFLGFSSFSNEYNLLRVIYHISSIGEVIVKAEVYAKSTESWVGIDVKMGSVDSFVHLSFYRLQETMPVVRNGIFYWLVSSLSDAHVVSFDVSEGFFDETNILHHIVDVEEPCGTIIVFKEEISLIIYSDDCKFKLWAPNENRNSWTWKLRIDDMSIIAGPLENSGGIIAVVGYTRNGELLIEHHYENDLKLLLYDRNSQETKCLPCADVQGANNFYFDTKSLCLVKARNEVAEAE